MSTTSTNFQFVLATTADQVNVVTQIANNFSSIDSIIGAIHTGTGELKSGISITGPTLVNPTISGTLSSNTLVATTGNFQTITATGGSLTANTLAIGTWAMPSTIGLSGQILTVVTGNAGWVSNAPGTGASDALDNLASVAINTSLNTFSAGFVTVARIIATSGSLSGITAVNATTGTFTNMTVAGTVDAQVVNMTGGSITAANLTIGTYAYPNAIGTTGQVLTVTSGPALAFKTPELAQSTSYFFAYATSGDSLSLNTGDEVALKFSAEEFDTASEYDASATATQFTVGASGLYVFGAYLDITKNDNPFVVHLDLQRSATNIPLAKVAAADPLPGSGGIGGQTMVLATSGDEFGIRLNFVTGSGDGVVVQTGGRSSYFYGYKVPDS